MIYLFGILGTLYLLAMGALVYGFIRLISFSSEANKEANSLEREHKLTTFSVIVPFRNEADHLYNLLESLSKLKYPSKIFEIILVDDASEDESEMIVKEFLKQNSNLAHITLITNQRHSASPKKDAITTAVAVAKYDWIVTTDADCIVRPNWLSIMNQYIQRHQPSMLAGPVDLKTNSSFISHFQLLDSLSLQAVTIGSFGIGHPLLSNGANLSYKKASFLELEGFKGNDHIASGDDIFMLEKMKKGDMSSVQFLKSPSAIVTTHPKQNWRALISQRIRWASKTKNQQNWRSTALGLIVFLTNLFLIIGSVIVIFRVEFFWYYIAYLLLKLLVDLIVIATSASFYKSKINAIYFLMSYLCYPFVVIRVVAGSLMGGYHWKGRKFENQPIIK